MQLTSGLVGAEVKGPIGWLIWDNPSKLNALSPGMYEDALSVVEDYAADPAIKVVVMRGAGRKAFISGADIKSFEKTRANAETTRLARETSAELRHKLLDLEKPLIAMIYGYCLGGGLGMALNADLRFASSDAQFGIPAAVRGAAYGLDGLKRWLIWSGRASPRTSCSPRGGCNRMKRCASAWSIAWSTRRNWKT